MSMSIFATYAHRFNRAHVTAGPTLVKGRAVRLVGELLKEIEPKQGARTDREPRAGDHPKLQTRASVAEAAGLSPHQTKEAKTPPGKLSPDERQELKRKAKKRRHDNLPDGAPGKSMSVRQMERIVADLQAAAGVESLQHLDELASVAHMMSVPLESVLALDGAVDDDGCVTFSLPQGGTVARADISQVERELCAMMNVDEKDFETMEAIVDGGFRVKR